MNRGPHRITTALGLMALLGACQVLPPASPTPGQTLDDTLASARTEPPPPPPAAVSEALLPPLRINPPALPPGPDEPRFDVIVDRVPAREFFLSLVEGTPINLVVHPEVQGEITLRLKNVTVGQTLEAVREVYGYDYRRGPNGYQVLPATLQTRMFPLNYLNVDRQGRSSTRVSSGEIARNDDTGLGGGIGNEEQGANLTGSSVQTRSDANFWQELRETLQGLLGITGEGGAEGRTVVVSPQSGLVMVRAMPAELRQVADFLAAAQLSLNRQVILEAKILEVALDDGYQAGINWTTLGGDDDDGVLAGQTGGGSLLEEQGSPVNILNLVDAVSGAFNPFDREAGIASDTFGGAFSLALRIDDFAAFIELLSTQGNVQVLSSPRVATLNNQKAVIKVGTDEFFITDISSDIVSDAGAGSVVSPEITLTPFFSGIALDVTPQIDADGYITLHIHPTVSDVTDQQKTFTVNGQEQSLPLALSSVREADSIIRARSGQVVVIGGLMQNETREQLAATPVLGDLPFVGSLFRHTQQAARKSELVILLRPVVVDSPGWQQAIRESADRFRQLDRGFHAGGRPEVFGTLGELPDY